MSTFTFSPVGYDNYAFIANPPTLVVSDLGIKISQLFYVFQFKGKLRNKQEHFPILDSQGIITVTWSLPFDLVATLVW